MKIKSLIISVLLLICLLTVFVTPVFADDEQSVEDAGAETQTDTVSEEQPDDEPSEEPSAGESAEEPSVEELSEEPSAEEPSEEPSAEEPSEEPSAEEPSEEPSVEEPSEEPSEEEPSEEPAEDPNSITRVDVQVAVPKVGVTPMNAKSLTSGVSVVSTDWTPGLERFKNNHTYVLRIKLSTKFHPFSRKCTATVNGAEAEFELLENGKACVTIEFLLYTDYKIVMADTDNVTFEVDKDYVGYSYRKGVSTFEYEPDDHATVHFYPADGYQINKVDVNGELVEITDNTLTLEVQGEYVLEPVIEEIAGCQIEITTAVAKELEDAFSFVVDGKTYKSRLYAQPGTSILAEVVGDAGQDFVVTSAVFDSRDGEVVFCTVTENKIISIPSAYEGRLKVAIAAPENAVYIIQPEHGRITADNPVPSPNESVIFTFTPELGYELDSVVFNGNPITLSGDTYEAIAAGVLRVSAYFKPASADVTVTLTALPDSEGVLHGTAMLVGQDSDIAVVKEGTYIGVSVTADNGYEIDAFTVNGKTVTPNSDGQTRVLIEKDTEITVSFKKIQYRITAVVTKNGGGTITAEGAEIVRNVVYVDSNGSITFRFTPDMNYQIYSVKVDSVEVYSEDSGDTYTFSKVDSNHTIAVTFISEDNIVVKYNITASAGENGTVTPAGVTEVIQGETVVYTVAPAEGYEIEYVKVDGMDVSLENGSYTFGSVSADHSIVASFREIVVITDDKVNVSDINWTSGTIRIDISGKSSVSKDVFAKLVSECSGRRVTVAGADNEVSFAVGGFASPAEDVDLSVLRNTQCSEYAQIGAAIASNAQYANCPYYVVKVSDFYPVDSELSVTLGSSFADMEMGYYGYDNGALVRIAESVNCSSGGRITVQIKDQRTLVFISRKPVVPTYDVNVIVGENGKVTPSATQNVESGMPVTFEITPDKGYKVNRILVNGESAEAQDGKITVTVTSNTTVDVRFSLAEEAGSKTGLIVSIVIIAIAVIGGIVLFVIKLKQNRY